MKICNIHYQAYEEKLGCPYCPAQPKTKFPKEIEDILRENHTKRSVHLLDGVIVEIVWTYDYDFVTAEKYKIVNFTSEVESFLGTLPQADKEEIVEKILKQAIDELRLVPENSYISYINKIIRDYKITKEEYFDIIKGKP